MRALSTPRGGVQVTHFSGYPRVGIYFCSILFRVIPNLIEAGSKGNQTGASRLWGRSPSFKTTLILESASFHEPREPLMEAGGGEVT